MRCLCDLQLNWYQSFCYKLPHSKFQPAKQKCPKVKIQILVRPTTPPLTLLQIPVLLKRTSSRRREKDNQIQISQSQDMLVQDKFFQGHTFNGSLFKFNRAKSAPLKIADQEKVRIPSLGQVGNSGIKLVRVHRVLGQTRLCF